MRPPPWIPLLSLLLLVPYAAWGQGYDSAQDFAAAGGRFQAVPDAASLMDDLQPHLGLRTKAFLLEQPAPTLGNLAGAADSVSSNLVVQAHAEGTIALFNHLLVGFDVPTQYSGADGVGLRDSVFRLGGRFLGGEGDPLAIGVDGWAFAPAGSEGIGDRSARGFGRLVLSGDTPRVSWATHAGYYHHEHVVISDDYQIGPSLMFGLATGVNLGRDRLYVGPEVWGMTMLPQQDGAAMWDIRSTPVEGAINAKYRIGRVVLGAGAGRGLTSTPGTSAFSSSVGISVITDPFRADSDKDGVANADDACLNLVGERHDAPARNGCPDKDNDTFLDPVDACPDLSGPDHPDIARRGCPDRDQDGEIDTIDVCPDEPGVGRTDPDTNGCPAGSGPERQVYALAPVAPSAVEQNLRPRFAVTGVKNFDLGFAAVADIHVMLLAVQRRFDEAVENLRRATGAAEGVPLQAALAAFKAEHKTHIVIMGNFQTIPPRLGAVALPGSPEAEVEAARRIDAALQEVLAVSTEGFRQYVKMTELFAVAADLITLQVPERRKLARKGPRGVGEAILLGDRTRANIERAQASLHLYDSVVDSILEQGTAIVEGLGDIWTPTTDGAGQELPK